MSGLSVVIIVLSVGVSVGLFVLIWRIAGELAKKYRHPLDQRRVILIYLLVCMGLFLLFPVLINMSTWLSK